LSRLVVDNSVVLAWCLADESHPIAEEAMQAVVEHGAVVPGIWWYELRNALVANERRGRLAPADTQATLTDVRDLGIAVDHDHDEGVLLSLARSQDLSIYDAAYLEVASRRGFPLATLDEGLRAAAIRVGVDVLGRRPRT
jgi:predicted nucleic acid-binding protein